MQRWLITGASGFLGANAGLWLRDRAHRTGLARSPVAAALFDDVLPVDLLDDAALIRAVETSRPDVILHCAALASHELCERDPGLAERMNADATRTLAQAAAAVGAIFVYISTDSVFDGARGGYAETDAPAPFSVYGTTKLLGEKATQDVDVASLIVRTNFFGWSPTGSRSILEFFTNALRAEHQVPGYTDFVVTSIYVRHLVAIVHELVVTGRRGLVHVASSDALSKFDFGRAVASQFGLSPELVVPTTAPAPHDSPSRARDLSLATRLLAGWLGSPPATQLEGLRDAYDDEATVPADLRASKETP